MNRLTALPAELIVVDPAPLIHLASCGLLGKLVNFGKVIVVDMVEIEATRELTKPFAAEINAWLKAETCAGRVEIGETPTGETYRLALKVNPEYRQHDAGEIAIAAWLYEHVESTDAQMLVLYEDLKFPKLLKNLLTNCDVSLVSTRAFLKLCKKVGR
jgi:hypothetical protein